METKQIKLVVKQFCAIVIYLALECRYHGRCIYRNIIAFITGYGSYKSKIQFQLDHNQKIYADMRQYEAGFYYNGQVHPWNEAKLF